MLYPNSLSDVECYNDYFAHKDSVFLALSFSLLLVQWVQETIISSKHYKNSGLNVGLVIVRTAHLINQHPVQHKYTHIQVSQRVKIIKDIQAA